MLWERMTLRSIETGFACGEMRVVPATWRDSVKRFLKRLGLPVRYKTRIRVREIDPLEFYAASQRSR